MDERMEEGNGSETEHSDIEKMTFEQALGALEDVVQKLERGDVPLDKSIELYEYGEKLRAACQKRLDSAQARIERIVQGSDGKPTGTAPLDGAS
jgi:exodeoxyribonuclease VII small subunit